MSSEFNATVIAVGRTAGVLAETWPGRRSSSSTSGHRRLERWTLGEIPDQHVALNELARVIRPGGLLGYFARLRVP